MEHTIYNESLVYYALRNPNTGTYLHLVESDFDNKKLAHSCTMFKTIDYAKETQTKWPEYSQIRKVKVIDIGELNENLWNNKTEGRKYIWSLFEKSYRTKEV